MDSGAADCRPVSLNLDEVAVILYFFCLLM